VAKQNVGSLGPTEGAPVTAYCPLGDSLRGALLWFVLLVLLLRRSNRSRQAWAVLLPLAAIYVTVGVVESRFTCRGLFYSTLHACSVLCESLRTLAVAIAVLLAISDRITLRNRMLRFLLVLGILFAAGVISILPNAPVVSGTAIWIAEFGFYLLVFLIGHAILHTLLRWLSGRRELVWSMGVALVIGIGPLLAFPIVVMLLRRFSPFLSTWTAFREVMTRAEALSRR